MSAQPPLYRYLWISDLGYTVYRKVFDESRCSIEHGARAHQVAVFVQEREALDYCIYRNRLLMERGTDAIRRPTKQQRERHTP